MGGNPAENHPVGFKWFIEAKKSRNAKLVVVDPRFTRTAAVADLYSPIRVGTDIAYLFGMVRYALETGRFHEEYVRAPHERAPHRRARSSASTDGLFSGFDAEKGEYAKDTWAYELDAKGFARTDPTLQHPRCVFQLLKKHVGRYTPEMVERICGVPKETFLKVAEVVTSTGNAERVGTVTYALGWTQHSTGVQMIRAAAILQLLLGNVGRPGGGVNAFRGHSNIQGATDTAGTFETLPGYLRTPRGEWATLEDYLERARPQAAGRRLHELLAELPEVHGLAPQGGLRREGHAGRTTSATRGCPRSTATTPGCTSSTTCTGAARSGRGKRAGPRGAHQLRHEPRGHRPELEEDGGRPREAQVAGGGGERGDGDRDLLEGAPGARGASSRADPDRGVPAPGRQLRGEGRDLHQLGPLAPVEVEGARSARPGQGRSGDPGPAVPGRARRSTRRRAVRSPKRSRASPGATRTPSGPIWPRS